MGKKSKSEKARKEIPALPSLHMGPLVVLMLVVATGVSVVYAKHESRKLFMQLQSLQREQDQIDVEWGRLQLEQSAYATHGRVERLARERLDMHMPDPQRLVVVEP